MTDDQKPQQQTTATRRCPEVICAEWPVCECGETEVCGICDGNGCPDCDETGLELHDG